MWTQFRYDPDRLAKEWKEARWQAIAPFIKEPVREKKESDWIHAVNPSDRDAVLGAVSEAGRKLGAKVRDEIGEEPTLGEIVQLLSHAEIHCFQGDWKSTEHGLARKHCYTSCPFAAGAYDCDYWREVARGFVSGLSHSIAFARHESIGHQGDGCVDVLYLSPGVDLKYGFIPPEVMEAVAHLVEDLNRWKVSCELVGFNEGTLYVRLVGHHFPVCGSCRRLVLSELNRALAGVEPPATVGEVAAKPEIPGTGATESIRPASDSPVFGFLRRWF